MIDLEKIKKTKLDYNFKRLIDILENKPFIIFGTTKYSEIIASFAKSKGNLSYYFIDDFKSGGMLDGVKILHIDEADKNLPVFSGVIEGRNKQVHELLINTGFRNVFSYLWLNASNKIEFPVPFWDNNKTDIESNFSKYCLLFDLLHDDLSRLTLSDLLYFRYTNDFVNTSFQYRLWDQYWEKEFINFDTLSSFLDGGSYDGLTTLHFSKLASSASRFFVFEPYGESMKIVKKNLDQLSGVSYFQEALYSDSKPRPFSTSSNSANSVVTDGDTCVPCISIDKALNGEQVDMIKLDIEGAEPEAIKGATNTILKDHPILAISVYHNQSHFWLIPELVLGIRNDYYLYLRHYTEGIYESIMFFIPKRNLA